MKSRLLSLRKNIAKLLEIRKKFPSATEQRKYATKSTHCDAHMNELPVPCGPWEPYYNDCQSFYNKILVLGVLWFGFSFAMMLQTGSFYLNWAPPAQPAPPSDMIQDSDDKC